MPRIKTARGENPYAKSAEWVAYCDLCGDRFTRQRNHLEESDGCFCSPDCRSEYRKRENDRWRCARCGHRLHGDESGYCSEECFQWATNWREHYPVEKRVYRIRIETEPEPLPFQGQLWMERRRSALDRDDHQCVICDMSEEEHRLRYSRVLDVHHKTPRREFDTAEEAHSMKNLITLCVRCHGLVESVGVEKAREEIRGQQMQGTNLDERIRAIVRDEIEGQGETDV